MHQIGVGVLGPVFRTFEPDGDRLVALKAFYLDLTPEQARTLADLLLGTREAAASHPVLVPTIDAGVADDIPYLATEYVAAESLDVAIRHYAPAPIDTAFPLIVQLADGLDSAHACGLMHGALHLRDLFLTPELARIAGFGVVPALEQVGQKGPLRRPYTAPEQMSTDKSGPAADRFALAAIVYELLTGRRASGPGDHMTEQLTCVAGPRGAARLAPVFASALAVAPGERPASARVFADQLADAVGWPGAEAVREALAAMVLGDTDDRLGAEDASAAAVTEGHGAGMANTDKPEDASKAELDWSERSLDRGETDEVRRSAGYTPRSVGPPAGFQRPGEEAVTPADYPRQDVDVGLDDVSKATVWSARDAAAADPEDAVLDATLGDARGRDGRLADESSGDEFSDLTLSSAVAGDDRGALPLSHVYGPIGSPGPGLSRAPAGDDVESYDDEDDDYQVVESAGQARLGEDRPAPTDSQRADAYEPISLSVLADRLGDESDAQDAQDEADEDEFGDLGLGASGAAIEGAAALSLPLGDDEHYDYDDGPEDDAGDSGYDEDATAAWPTAKRRLPVVPLALLALAVVAVAFAIGFGWLSGGTSEGGATEGGRLAAGLEASDGAAGTVAGEAAAEQDFSEATISDAPPEAPAEPEPDTPAPAAAAEDRRPTAPPPSRSEPTPPPAPVANDGRLLVRSMPPGAQVAVNGEPRGITPLALSDLRYADYDLSFTLAGYEMQERRLTISAADPIAAVDARLTPVPLSENQPVGVGSIFVDTRPPGVEVWLDRRLVGETPMLLPDVASGSHTVEFKYDGYRDWSTTVQVNSATQARVAASLLPAH
jgi:hypothetical protein